MTGKQIFHSHFETIFFSNQAISKIIHKKQQWETITGETSSYYTIDSKMSLWKDHLSHLIWNMNTKWFFKKINLFFFLYYPDFFNIWYLEFFDIFSCWLLTTPVLNVFFVMGRGFSKASTIQNLLFPCLCVLYVWAGGWLPI